MFNYYTGDRCRDYDLVLYVYRVGLPTALANLRDQCLSAVIGAGLIDPLCRLRAAIARRLSPVS